MKTYTASFSTNSYISQGTYIIENSDIYLKGETEVTIDLTEIDESVTYVKNITIDWGDGSDETTNSLNLVKDYYTETIIPEVLYNKDVSVCTQYTHTYLPNAAAYFTKYQCVITMTFLNDFVGRIYIPFYVAQASYYDSVDDLFILNSQILPLSSNNTFLNLQVVGEKYVLPFITN